MQIEHHIEGFVLFLTDIIYKNSGLLNALSARNEKVPGIVEFGPTIHGIPFSGNLISSPIKSFIGLKPKSMIPIFLTEIPVDYYFMVNG